MLTDPQKHALVDLARRAVAAQVAGLPDVAPLDIGLPDASGVFVTIKRRGELRGCLGTLQCSRGLAAEVARCAADAVSEDPRVPPVAADELPELSVEVSVLGPLEEIDPRDSEAITVGRHGLARSTGSGAACSCRRWRSSGMDLEQFSPTCPRPDSGRRLAHDARISRLTPKCLAMTD